MSSSSMFRVALIGRHALFVDCLATVMEKRQLDVRKVAAPDSEHSVQATLARVLAARPAVAVISVDAHGPGDEAQLVEPLARSGVSVVVLTESVDEPQTGRYLASGARVVISKTESLARVVSVVRRLTHGLRVLEADERDRLLRLHFQDRTHARQRLELLERLSRQERQILRHLMAGRPVREIAAFRVVSEATVRTQVKSVLSKLEVSSQLSAVALAHSARWYVEPMSTEPATARAS